MPVMNIIEAVNSALRMAMAADDRVVVLGEDVGKFGGVFRATKGLYEEFGAERSIDTPLAEGGIIGHGDRHGALRVAARSPRSSSPTSSSRPSIRSSASSPSIASAPVVNIGADGDPHPHGRRHQGRPLPLAVARGVLHPHAGPEGGVPVQPVRRQGPAPLAIRDEDPVMFFEPKRVYRASKGEVPEGSTRSRSARPQTVRPGKDLTVVAWGAMLHEAKRRWSPGGKAGPRLRAHRSADALWPLDIDTMVESVKKTGRFDRGARGPAHLRLRRRAFDLAGDGAGLLSPEAQPVRVTGFDTPFPYTLENEYLPRAPADPGRVPDKLAADPVA
jgi:pyruvate dehydrogenase E1 component beta subunit